MFNFNNCNFSLKLQLQSVENFKTVIRKSCDLRFSKDFFEFIIELRLKLFKIVCS